MTNIENNIFAGKKKNITVINLREKSENQIIVTSGNSSQKKFASENNPTIEAIITKMFKFDSMEQAIGRLEAIKNHFTISSKLQSENENEVKLWIRGFEITEEEKKHGYLGNYAAIKIQKLDNGLYTLLAEKQGIDLKFHPQKVRPKRKHPDWGHPALRAIKKNTIFKTTEEAQKLLEQLHTEYPDISIPNPGKLYIIIYSKAVNMSSPVQKFILEIKVSENGGFYIDHRINEKK